MTGPAYWAWARDGSAMHAWPLTADEVQQAKADGTKHKTVCDWAVGIGERPTQPPRAEAELNHCADCWAILHPRLGGGFLDALIRPDLPRTDTRWRRTG